MIASKLKNLGLALGLSTLGIVAGGCVVTTKAQPSDPAPETTDGGASGDAGAPDDFPQDPGGAAPEPKVNNLKPAAQFRLAPDAAGVVRVSLLGLIDPTTNAPVAFKANESVFVTEDNVLKGIRVTQASATNQLPMDIVFVVDNSPSMGDEADGIADKIVAFANVLTSSGLDVRLGVVGYDGSPTGGIDLGSASAMEAFLKRPNQTGTARTKGFAGANAAALDAASNATPDAWPSGENGIAGVVFAEKHFAFRAGAQRVFINFTDEPTQPARMPEWTTKTLCARWTPTTGTIHTIWSGGRPLAELTWRENVEENPADLSTCTPGGVVKAVKSDASDLDLTTLPLTSALASSALVEFKSSNPTVPHDVVVTVKNGETADGKTVFARVTY